MLQFITESGVSQLIIKNGKNSILTEVIVDDSEHTVECKDLKERVLYLKETNPSSYSLLELGPNKLMVNNLLIEDFQVIGKVHMPEGDSVLHPVLAPFFDPVKFPYVIAIGR